MTAKTNTECPGCGLPVVEGQGINYVLYECRSYFMPKDIYGPKFEQSVACEHIRMLQRERDDQFQLTVNARQDVDQLRAALRRIASCAPLHELRKIATEALDNDDY